MTNTICEHNTKIVNRFASASDIAPRMTKSDRRKYQIGFAFLVLCFWSCPLLLTYGASIDSWQVMLSSIVMLVATIAACVFFAPSEPVF